MAEQLTLDLDFATEIPSEDVLDDSCWLRRADLQRAVLRWLAAHDAQGAATKVPTRRASYRADVAAFWSKPVKHGGRGPGTLNRTARTIVVECRTDREACWPDCTNSEELLPKLRRNKRRMHDLQEQIRRDEPHLKRCDSLFDEYAEWNFQDSENPEYRSLADEVRNLEASLYRGTRFEILRDAAIADQVYLAVPENAVHPRELADGWGLIWVNEELEISLVTAAGDLESEPEVRTHLMQNIAAAAFSDVLFRNGIGTDADGLYFNRPPRRRRRESFQ